MDDGKSETLPKIDDFMYPSFNAGRRSCLGREMALLEMTAVLATLYHRYEFKAQPGGNMRVQLPTEGSKPTPMGARHDLPYLNSLTMPQDGGLEVTVARRQVRA